MTIRNFTDHAANERTFLAWVRAALAVVAFGFLVERFDLLIVHAAWTAAEMLLGLALGLLLGCALAIVFVASAGWRRWALPLVIASQAIPVIAIAPLLVLWLGFGMASKVAMAALVIFFPVASTFYDGLRRTEAGWPAPATGSRCSSRSTSPSRR